MSHPSPNPSTAEPLSIDDGMPPTVVAAVIIEALLSAQSLFAGQVIWAGTGALLCVGLHHRVVIAQRLVLIAALLFSLFVGGLLVATALSVMSIDAGPQFTLLGLGLLPGVLYVAVRIAQIVALTRPDARRFFNLECPACGSHAFRAKDVLYSRLGCKACGHAWPTGRR